MSLISVDAIPEYSTVAVDKDTQCARLTWLLKIKAASELPSGTAFAPLNLILLVDRSPSMAFPTGGKLLQAMDLTRKLVTALNPASDRVALITFCTKATVRYPLGAIDTPNLQTAINSMDETFGFDGEKTNLEDALREARKMTKGLPNKQTTSILLLTDGDPNEGLTRIEELERLVRDLFPIGVSLHTFGLGNEHRADLLQALSRIGHVGQYHYVHDSASLYRAVARVVGNLQTLLTPGLCMDFDDGNCDPSFVSVEPAALCNYMGAGILDFGALAVGEERQVLLTVDVRQEDVPVDEDDGKRVIQMCFETRWRQQWAPNDAPLAHESFEPETIEISEALLPTNTEVVDFRHLLDVQKIIQQEVQPRQMLLDLATSLEQQHAPQRIIDDLKREAAEWADRRENSVNARASAASQWVLAASMSRQGQNWSASQQMVLDKLDDHPSPHSPGYGPSLEPALPPPPVVEEPSQAQVEMTDAGDDMHEPGDGPSLEEKRLPPPLKRKERREPRHHVIDLTGEDEVEEVEDEPVRKRLRFDKVQEEEKC